MKWYNSTRLGALKAAWIIKSKDEEQRKKATKT